MTQIKEGDKLYIIARQDISPGYQAVQGMHALRQFVKDHPDIDKEWFEKSNYLGFLSVENEHALIKLAEQALAKGIKFSIFREPDIDNQITAIAIEPGPKSKKLCSNLQLGLKEYDNEVRMAR